MLLEETLKIFEKSADKKGVRLVIDSPEDLSVEADAERLLQVMSNLVGNAIEFSPPSGDIAIGARHVDDLVRFFVRDSGFGIRATNCRTCSSDIGKRAGADTVGSASGSTSRSRS